MTNTFTWIAERLDCYPTYENESDVVFTVHWRHNAADAQAPEYSATRYGACGVTYVVSQPYTPYADLTQDQVLGWIWDSAVNKEETQAALDTAIAAQLDPPVISPPLPWTSQDISP